jgi:hypothetical protein
MSLSQFMYNLAGAEEEFPESELPTARTEEMMSPVPNQGEAVATAPTEVADAQSDEVEEPITSEPVEDAVLTEPTETGLPRPSVEAEEDPISVVESPPVSPTSFLGYFFGGVTSPTAEAPPAQDATLIMEPDHVPQVEEEEVQEGFGSFLFSMVRGELEEESANPEETPQEAPPALEAVAPSSALKAIANELDVSGEIEPPFKVKGGNPELANRKQEILFKDRDAESMVEQIETGRAPAKRLLLPTENQVQMKLEEARTAVRKLRLIQDETYRKLGIVDKKPKLGDSKIATPSIDQVTKEVLERSELVLNQSRVHEKPVDPSKTTSRRVSGSKLPDKLPIPTREPVRERKRLPTYKPPYRANHAVYPLNVPISDRFKFFPVNQNILHANAAMPNSFHRPLNRNQIVVASVECFRPPAPTAYS